MTEPVPIPSAITQAITQAMTQAMTAAMALPRRAIAVLPDGTIPVAIGLAVLGAGSYAHLAFAGHALDPAAMADMSVLWVIVYVAGIGLFFPVEQELIRLVAARAASGAGTTGVVRQVAVLAGAVLAATLVPLAVAARPLARVLFGGDTAIVAVLGGGLAVLAVASVSRGVLAGLGRFGAYGCQLAVDGGLRVVLAAALAAGGVHSAMPFGLVLVAAPLLSVAVTCGPLVAGLRRGPGVGWGRLCRMLGQLTITMLLAQLVVNIAVITQKVLQPGSPAVVGALLSAMVLARVPLFVFTSLQASLLPGLAGAVAANAIGRFRRLMIRGAGIVTALGLAGGILAVAFGPWLIQVLFGARPVLGPADFAVLACGTLWYMLAMVLGQGVMALSGHRDQMLAWVAGAGVLAGVTALPGGVTLRVEAAYALSSLTVMLAMLVALSLRAAARRGGMRGSAAGAAPSGECG